MKENRTESDQVGKRLITDVEKKHREFMGKRLKQFRMALGYKQSEMSSVLQIKRNNLSRMETGNVLIKDVVKYRLYHLGCNLNWLITGEGDQNTFKGMTEEGKKLAVILRKSEDEDINFLREKILFKPKAD